MLFTKGIILQSGEVIKDKVNLVAGAITQPFAEMTREEKAAIRRLVIFLCANYDREQGCLPLDCDCYMLGKCWTGAYCRYFRESVLPTNPVLEAALTRDGPAPDTKTCPVCGGAYLPTTS